VGANIVINQINDVFLHETLYDMTHKAIKWIENQMKKLAAECLVECLVAEWAEWAAECRVAECRA